MPATGASTGRGAAMPASTEPAFGQVWRYRMESGMTTDWILIAPLAGSSIGYWFVLHTGRALLEANIKAGKDVLEQMAGLPGSRYVDKGWERVL